MNEMSRLKAAIMRQYEDDVETKMEVHNPRNTESLNLYFRGQKTAKVVGRLAMTPPENNAIISGILLRRNYNFHLVMPSDLSVYTELSTSALTQRKGLYYDGELALLVYNIGQLTDDHEVRAATQTDKGLVHTIFIFEASRLHTRAHLFEASLSEQNQARLLHGAQSDCDGMVVDAGESCRADG